MLSGGQLSHLSASCPGRRSAMPWVDRPSWGGHEFVVRVASVRAGSHRVGPDKLLLQPSRAPGGNGYCRAGHGGVSHLVLLHHPAKASGSLSDAFTRGVDVLIRALFHLPAVPPAHYVPGPGQIGWLVIAVLLVIGYRLLEALSQHCHARCLDTSELTPAQQAHRSGHGKGALTDVQRHDRLAAELKFWLPAVEVRAPAILPGGSRSTANRPAESVAA